MKRLTVVLALAAAACSTVPAEVRPLPDGGVELPVEDRLAEALAEAYREAAAAFLRGDRTPADYLATSRSISAQRRLLQSDGARLSAWSAGDEDHDLVPDDRDRCPGTERNRPVDETGCPIAVDPRSGPRDEDVRAVLARLGFMESKLCQGAPVPQVPAPLKYGYDNVTRETLAFAVTPVNNQPQGCVVFYEFRAVFIGGGSSFDTPNSTHRVVFHEKEATEKSQRLVFRVDANSADERLSVFTLMKYHSTYYLQVRAMNGAGLTSGWSALVPSALSFGEP
ncbi:MAG: hypothetical protein IPJ65_14240 [Archangiaceae bacterium]|nr:hypothetical protein [Archangiaceae bacterium]